jgi:hypothetical protein
MLVASERFTGSCFIWIVGVFGKGRDDVEYGSVYRLLSFIIGREPIVVSLVSGAYTNGNFAVRHSRLAKSVRFGEFNLFLKFVAKTKAESFLNILKFFD